MGNNRVAKALIARAEEMDRAEKRRHTEQRKAAARVEKAEQKAKQKAGQKAEKQGAVLRTALAEKAAAAKASEEPAAAAKLAAADYTGASVGKHSKRRRSVDLDPYVWLPGPGGEARAEESSAGAHAGAGGQTRETQAGAISRRRGVGDPRRGPSRTRS